MMEKLTRWVFGTAIARISGDTTRFINVLVRSGVSPLEMHSDGEDMVLTVRANRYRKLHPVKLRTGARVRLLKKSGLPFMLRKLIRRPGLPIGTVLGTVLFLWLSGFYWCVDIQGEAPYAYTEIQAAARASGVFIGAAKKDVDLPSAANQLIRQLPGLSWASFNSEGCAVTLEFRAALEEKEGADKEGAYDVVAARAGLVKKIAAQNGTVLVEVGSVVLEGQMLVSGVTVIGDPYDPEQEVRHLLSHARAEIMAETRHIFSASCPLRMESRREVETGTRKMLYVLGLRIPLSLNGAPEGEVTALEQKPLQLLGVTLPVWIEIQRCGIWETVTVEFTEEEAKRRVYEEIRQLEENYLGETGTLLSEEVQYTLQNGVLYASAHCVVEEDIAKAVSMTEGQVG